MFRLLPFAVVAVAVGAGCKSHPSPATVCLDVNPPGDMGASDMGPGPCFVAPTAAVSRTACTGDLTRNCDANGGSAPNLACVNAAPADMLGGGGGGFVTLSGYAHVWSAGNDSVDVAISVYDATQLANGQDPATLSALGSAHSAFTPSDITPDRRRACDVDQRLGCVAVDPDRCATPCNDGLGGRRDAGQYCASDGSCHQRLHWEAPYVIPNVPLGRPLVFRATSTTGRSNAIWATTHQWNVTLPVSPRACAGGGPNGGSDLRDTECLAQDISKQPVIDPATGKPVIDPVTNMPEMKTLPTVTSYRHNVTVLSTLDYTRLASTSGAAGGVQAGKTLVIGEAHDCDGVRLANVQVTVMPSPARFSYWSGGDARQVPDPTRVNLGTAPLGSFVAVDVPPGKTTVDARGGFGDPLLLTPVGRLDYTAYADTVTLVELNAAGQDPGP